MVLSRNLLQIRVDTRPGVGTAKQGGPRQVIVQFPAGGCILATTGHCVPKYRGLIHQALWRVRFVLALLALFSRQYLFDELTNLHIQLYIERFDDIVVDA